MTRRDPPADFAFLFNDKGIAVEADTLAQALEMRPDLKAEQLESVFCLHTTNLVWGFVDDPRPWKDPDFRELKA